MTLQDSINWTTREDDGVWQQIGMIRYDRQDLKEINQKKKHEIGSKLAVEKIAKKKDVHIQPVNTFTSEVGLE